MSVCDLTGKRKLTPAPVPVAIAIHGFQLHLIPRGDPPKEVLHAISEVCSRQATEMGRSGKRFTPRAHNLCSSPCSALLGGCLGASNAAEPSLHTNILT